MCKWSVVFVLRRFVDNKERKKRKNNSDAILYMYIY